MPPSEPGGRIDRDLLMRLRSVVVLVADDGSILDVAGGFRTPGLQLHGSIGRSLFDCLDDATAAATARHLGRSTHASTPVEFPAAFATTIVDPDTGATTEVDIAATGIDGPGGSRWIMSLTPHSDLSTRVGLAAELYGRVDFGEACRAAVEHATTQTPDGRRCVLHVVVQPHSADRRLITGDPASHLAVALGSVSPDDGQLIWPPQIGEAELPDNGITPEMRTALHADDMSDCHLARIGSGVQAYAWLLWAVSGTTSATSRAVDELARRDIVDLLARAAQTATTGRQQNNASMVDSLTGLLNRKGLEATSSPVQVARAATVVVSVTNMPHINTRLGERTGDRLLGVVADQLRNAVRSGDYVARISGSEFALVMPETPRPEARTVARELTDSLRRIDMSDVSSIPPEVAVGVWTDPGAGAIAEFLNDALDPLAAESAAEPPSEPPSLKR